MGFNEDLNLILKFEGGYSNDPLDPGGATNKGITQYTYDSYRKGQRLGTQDVKNISDTEVSAIYNQFYVACGADKVTIINPRLATELFDFAINSGPIQAIRTLQRTVGVIVDGVLGSVTLGAINTDVNKIGVVAQSKTYALARVAFYFNLVEKTPTSKKFLQSWLSRPLTIEGLI